MIEGLLNVTKAPPAITVLSGVMYARLNGKSKAELWNTSVAGNLILLSAYILTKCIQSTILYEYSIGKNRIYLN